MASFGGSPPLPRRITESTRILRELGKVTLDIDDMPATGPEWKTIGFQVSGICGACCAWLRSVKRCGCWFCDRAWTPLRTSVGLASTASSHL